MTIYASWDDVIALYGQGALYVADHDRSGAPDMVAVDRALVTASSEIDSYIGVRVKLPLAAVPPILTQLCTEIALYRLASSADVLTDEHRRRYEDAIAHLRRISKGEAALIIPGTDTGDNSDQDDDGFSDSPRPIVAGGPPRIFSRAELRDF